MAIPFPPEINMNAPEAVQAAFALYVNHVERGLALIVVTENDVLVVRADLEEAGIGTLKGREVQLFDMTWLSLKSVSPPLKYELDEREIALHITAPPELLPTAKLDASNAPLNINYQNTSSGFMNYAARLTMPGHLDVYQEVGASHDGNLAFSSMYLSTTGAPIRGLTQYVINERETLRRMTIGDAMAQTGALGSVSFVGGVTLQRTYALNPYAITTPGLGYSFTAATPSTLEVYVNGALTRRDSIAPGTTQLENLRVGGGAGLTTYVLRDVFGQEQRIDIPFYISSSVLREGLDEYSYSLGALREEIGNESWGYERPAFLGRHRLGLAHNITVSGRAEATDQVISGGPAVTTLTPIGQVEVELAASHERSAGAGYATFASYSFLSRNFNGGMQGRLLSDEYASVSLPPTSDRIVREIGAFASMPFFHSMSLSANARIFDFLKQRDGFRVGAFVGRRVLPRLSVTLAAGLTGLADLGLGWDVFAGLTSSYGGQHTAVASTRIVNGDASFGLSANKGLPAVGTGSGYSANVTFDERTTSTGLLQHQTSFARLGAGYRYTQLDAPISQQVSVSLEAAGAVAVVPGIGLFPTLPVQDGFGVIRLKDVQGVRGFINNQEVGRTDRAGNLIVPSALSYYGNRFSVAPEDVPMRYVLDKEELIIAPPMRGVALAEFPAITPHYYRGRIVIIQQGKRVIPKYGQLRVPIAEGELMSPLAEQGEFELEGVRPGLHVALVDFAGATCELELNAPDSEEIVIDLGELICKLP